MAELSARKKELENQLADEKLYDAANKNELQQILLEQSKVANELEECEMLWMEKSELLEEKNREFAAL